MASLTAETLRRREFVLGLATAACTALPHKFQGELELTWGVCCAADEAEGGRAERGIRRREYWMVRQVEGFSSELEVSPLADAEVFEDREVYCLQPVGTEVRCAVDVAESVLRRQRELV